MLTSTSQRHQYFFALLFLGSIAAGAAVFRTPLALGLGGATFLLGLGLLFPRSIPRGFLGLLGIALIGYAFFGRSFAYLGAAPVFVGEAVLGFGLIAFALHRDRWSAFRHPVTWLLVAFCLWGGVRTLPFLSLYGQHALRDAVVWGYALLVLLLVPLLHRSVLINSLPAAYARCLPWFLCWIPVALVTRLLFGPMIPTMPGTDVKILAVKAGDLGAHLGGAAAFLMLSIGRTAQGQRERGSGYSEWLCWALWGIGFLTAASINRGGMLAAFAAIGVVILLQPRASIQRIWRAGAVLLSMLLLLLVADVSFERERGRRALSPQQVMLNAGSIFGEAPREGQLGGTREWRMIWWTKIIDYTVYGEYFWSGKGFGVNLAADDGMETGNARNRNPHNGHLTVLARSGVPGFTLWIFLQSAFAFSLVVNYVRARRAHMEGWASILAWILAYWTAFLVNMSFDVFLEGPQGGIWFWCIFGSGIAAMLGLKAASPGLASRDMFPHAGRYRI